MLLQIHPDNPDQRKIQQIVDCLRKGGVVIYPTDTVYSIGCDLMNKKALEKVARLKGVKPEKANFSLIFHNVNTLGDFTKQFDRHVFKVINRALPGPYTFILNASNKIPKLFNSNKKTVGIRIPDNNIARAIVEQLGNPIVATSVHDDDEVLEYTTDPELIYEKYQNLVDMVIDGGYGNNEASSVLDCTSDEIEVIREGIGSIDDIL